VTGSYDTAMLRPLSLLLVVLALTGAAEAQPDQGWTAYVNERFGFSLRYPAELFELERASEAGDGRVFVARDGDARLLVGAFANTDRHTVESYRRLIGAQSYADFQISYAPRGQTWFVLSGEGNGRMFYEKVIFSCGGSVINSFAMMYPLERRDLFDRVVEGIERTFRPAQRCRQYAGE
jgi:hypothetical protein